MDIHKYSTTNAGDYRNTFARKTVGHSNAASTCLLVYYLTAEDIRAELVIEHRVAVRGRKRLGEAKKSASAREEDAECICSRPL